MKKVNIILDGLLILLIAAVGIFTALSFFKVGISWKDIALILSVPLTLGAMAGYLVS